MTDQESQSAASFAPPSTDRSPVDPPTAPADELFPLAESLKGLPEALRGQFGDGILADRVYRGELTVWVKNELFFNVCRWLRDTPKWAFDFCSDVTAIDYLLTGAEPRFENVVNLYSLEHRHRVRVKCPVEEESMKCSSVTSLWATANYHERETFDMYGIQYEGHPDLCRILLPDDWEGYPLRKDFPLGGVKSFYFKHDTQPRSGEPKNLVPRIREQLSDI